MELTTIEFKKLVAEGLKQLPPWVHEKMHNVAVVVADKPTRQQRIDNQLEKDAVLFGLYEGVPQTERGFDYFALPDKITIFKKPILEAYENIDDVRECIANTVWHEVAHHFGMDEDQVHGEEIKRGKLL